MKKTSGVTIQFLAILAAFISSVAAKTEAEEDRDLIIILAAVALGVLVIALFLLIISCCCFWKMLNKKENY
ncbi:hypothetical protein ACROYT_G027663 [Oculina patagonica]